MALVFLHLFPLLENVGFCLGSVGKKAGWGVESGAGMRALGRESSKGVSWRGCGPSSFVMDVFILKTKVPFSAGTAGIGREKCLGGHRGCVKEPCSSIPSSATARVSLKGDLQTSRITGKDPKRVLFRWERGKPPSKAFLIPGRGGAQRAAMKGEL